MPSLLLHTAVLFLFESKPQIKRFLQQFIIVAIYLPVFPFSVIIKNFVLSEDTHLGITATPYIKPFVVWLITSLFIAANISRWLARMVEEKEERKFHPGHLLGSDFYRCLYWVYLSLGRKQDYLYWGLSCISLHVVLNLPQYYFLLLRLSV